jgi:hypothetical protein
MLMQCRNGYLLAPPFPALHEVSIEQEGIPTWIAVLVGTAIVVAFIIVGAILSAVFQMT